MKKKISMILACLILIAFVGGCAVRRAEDDPNQGSQEEQPPGQYQNYPDPVRVWLEEMKELFVANSMVVGNETFFMVSYGKRSTAGYMVSIEEIVERSDQTVVRVAMRKEGDVAAQVITYPYAVESVARVIPKDNVVFEDVDGEQYIPSLVGVEQVTTIIKDKTSPNIKLFKIEKGEDRVIVTGIARAFEATVNYAFTDSDQGMVQPGYVTAASGGPDWGYFELEQSIPNGSRYLELYLESAKDGSRMEEIVIDLE